MAQKKDPIKKLQQDMGELRTRVETLESERPGRKPKPLLAIKQRDVCAIDPDSDSTKCPFASIYRYQSGCHGAMCRQKQHEAYERRKAIRVNGKAVKVRAKKAPPTKQVTKQVSKRVTKKTVPARKAPAKVPAKRTVKRVVS